MLIVFYILKCGTPQQDDDLVDLIVKNLDNEEYNGYESGLPMDDVEKALEEAPSIDTPSLPSSFGSRKRKQQERQEELMEQQMKMQKQSIADQAVLNSVTIDFTKSFEASLPVAENETVQKMRLCALTKKG